MPILTIHLGEGHYSDAQCEKLLVETSRLYAEVLKSPIERVRVFIQTHKPSHIAVAGVPSSQSQAKAPYFHFLVLKGRSLEERHQLLRGFTDLIVEILQVDRTLVRGGCWPIPPEDWAIGGLPASIKRADEVEARVQAGKATA